MCSEHACDEQARIKSVTEKVVADRQPDQYRKKKCKQAEDKTPVPVLLKFVHIELQAGNKHDVEEPDRGE